MKKHIFIAINFETSFLKKDFEIIKKELEDKPIKWVEIENIHLTLAFLGSIPNKKIGFVEYAIEKNLRDISPLKIDLASLENFSRVLWIDAKIENKEKLKNFQERLIYDLSENFHIKNQKFVPHITIGRFKGKVKKDRITNIIKKYKKHTFGTVMADSIDLMESTLNNDGPKYKILKKFSLK